MLGRPAWARSAHLAAGASSPSRFGPSPHPQGLSCHQSSCRLRVCKRLQQTWRGGRGEVPRGCSSQDRAQLHSTPTPHVPIKALALAHTHPPHSQATVGQTNPLPTREGPAPSQHLLPHHPQSLLGGKTTHNCQPRGFQALPTPDRQSSPLPSRRPKVAAKKPEVNLRLDSAVPTAGGSSTTPGMHPKTSRWGRRPSWADPHPRIHTGFVCFFGGERGGEGEHMVNRHQNRK